MGGEWGDYTYPLPRVDVPRLGTKFTGMVVARGVVESNRQIYLRVEADIQPGGDGGAVFSYS